MVCRTTYPTNMLSEKIGELYLRICSFHSLIVSLSNLTLCWLKTHNKCFCKYEKTVIYVDIFFSRSQPCLFWKHKYLNPDLDHYLRWNMYMYVYCNVLSVGHTNLAQSNFFVGFFVGCLYIVNNYLIFSLTNRLLKILLPLENESSMCAWWKLFVISRTWETNRNGDSNCQRRAHRRSGLWNKVLLTFQNWI